MKNLIIKLGITLIALTVGCVAILAQTGGTAINADSDAATGLDLYAVAELFKDSENLEKFEQALNDPARGLNNLDLNKDNQVDFIRAVEQIKDNTHLIILQVPLGRDDYQDIATIAVEKESGEKYNLHIQGDTVLYGANYYVVPANNNFSAWDVVRWLFRPNYYPYVSRYSYSVLPTWWTVRQPVTLNVYRGRTGLFSGRSNFVASKTLTVRTINKIVYHPRTSPIVTRKAVVTHTTVVTKPSNANRPTQTTVKTQTKVTKVKKH